MHKKLEVYKAVVHPRVGLGQSAIMQGAARTQQIKLQPAAGLRILTMKESYYNIFGVPTL